MSQPPYPPPPNEPPNGPPSWQPPPPPPPQWQPPMQGWAPPPPPPGDNSRKTLIVVLAAIAAVVLIAAAVLIPVLVLGDDDDNEATGSSQGTDDGGEDEPDDDETTGEDVEANLDEVQTYEFDGGLHTLGEISYEQSPPAGGEHNPIWLDCGVYDVPVNNENAVHDLEHGTVWITYDPSLADDEVAELEDELPDNGILSPYEGQESPVVVTVWGKQLELVGADDPRLELFIAEFEGGVTAPEPFASCEGGNPDPNGSLE